MLLHLELFGLGMTGPGVESLPFRVIGVFMLSATGPGFLARQHFALPRGLADAPARTVGLHVLAGRLGTSSGETTPRGDQGPPPSIIASAKNHSLAQSH